MKTNVTMLVRFGKHILKVEHKTKLGSLNELVKIGNRYRREKGLHSMRIDKIVTSKWFTEYKEMLENKLSSQYPQKRVCDNQVVMKTKKRVNAGTWVHLKLLIRTAIQMDAEFADQVIETFITGKLLEGRDIAGDNYRLLSASASIFPDVDYRLIAKALNHIVFNKHEKEIRNTATPAQINELHQIEKQLAFSIDMGLIKRFEQLVAVMRKIYHEKYDEF